MKTKLSLYVLTLGPNEFLDLVGCCLNAAGCKVSPTKFKLARVFAVMTEERSDHSTSECSYPVVLVISLGIPMVVPRHYLCCSVEYINYNYLISNIIHAAESSDELTIEHDDRVLRQASLHSRPG